MNAKQIIENCPFREGSSSRKVWMAISGKPLNVSDICKKSKLSEKKVMLLLNAYRNPYHNAPLRRIGIEIKAEAGLFSLAPCKAEPNAVRPPRGKKKAKVKKAKHLAKKIAKPNSKPKTKPADKKKPSMPTPDSAPVPVQTPVPEPEPVDNTDAQKQGQ